MYITNHKLIILLIKFSLNLQGVSKSTINIFINAKVPISNGRNADRKIFLLTEMLKMKKLIQKNEIKKSLFQMLITNWFEFIIQLYRLR